MTRNQKRMLRFCCKHYRDTFCIKTEDLDPLNLPKEEIYTCCKNLYEENYLTRYSSAANHSVFFQLDHKGKHYREINMEELRSFLLRSILTPVLVSLITTLIMLFIKELLWKYYHCHYCSYKTHKEYHQPTKYFFVLLFYSFINICFFYCSSC